MILEPLKLSVMNNMEEVTVEKTETDGCKCPPPLLILCNPARIIPMSDSSEEDVNDNRDNVTRVPPQRPAEAFVDLESWLEHGCMPSNQEYMDWLRKSVDSEYAFVCLLECCQGRGRFERNKWKVAKNRHSNIERLCEDEYENAKDRAYSMLHGWLREEDEGYSNVWSAAEKALPLVHECLQEAENLDALNPHLDLSREKVGKCRRTAWAAYTEVSREVVDEVGDEILLFLTVYELLRDLKRDDSEGDVDCETSDVESKTHYATNDEDSAYKEFPPFSKRDYNDKAKAIRLVKDENNDVMSSSDESYECDESFSAIATRVPCQGRGARFKSIALMDILLSNVTSDHWEPDFDVDLCKMVVDALSAGKDTALSRNLVLPALSKVLSYWACRPGDFDEDHWDIFRLEILPALQVLKSEWSADSLSDAVDLARPKKRTKKVDKVQKDPNHLRHLRSEAADALLSLKDCASSFPVATANGDGGGAAAARNLAECIETVNWMLDEKCLEWMMDSEWRRPEIASN